jgi:HD superfamily phosphohydrolase YqeK
LTNYRHGLQAYGESVLTGTEYVWAVVAFERLFDAVGHLFSTSPASSSFSRHHCFEGGLMYHSVEVYYLTHLLYTQAVQRLITAKERAEIWIASILHDFNKCCDPIGRAYYVPNLLKGGKRSDAKPWKTNADFLLIPREVYESPNLPPGVGDGWARVISAVCQLYAAASGKVPEGLISLVSASTFEPEFERLDGDVMQAIIYHDGGYGQARYDLAGNESMLTITLHAADMMSSRFEQSWPQVDRPSELSFHLGPAPGQVPAPGEEQIIIEEVAQPGQ